MMLINYCWEKGSADSLLGAHITFLFQLKFIPDYV